MQKILCVEDESAIADAVIYALQTENFEVHWLKLGSEAVQLLHHDPDFALIILDVGLPDANGFEICKQIRRFSDVPIIFLTARSDEIDRIVGLEIGADDYVTKPFSPRELAARVKVILKRRIASQIPQDSDFVIDELKALIQFQGTILNLTRYEYLLLKYLLSQPERVFSREQILEAVWKEPESSLDRVVDTHIKTLRGKLRDVDVEANPIKTHRGLGYSISGSVRELR